MNIKLREKRMAEYTVVDSYIDKNDYAQSEEEIEGRLMSWIEDILNKYSDEDGY
ncbi:hypothetical protein [Paenibacillus taichungensis]